MAESKASAFFRAKHNRTEGYTTAQAAVLESQIRERSFWSSGVKSSKMLLGMRNCVDDVLSGKLSREESLIKLHEIIEKSGYVSPEGEEGSLKDLLSDKRQKAIIDMNVDSIHGYMRKAEALQNLDLFPCQELVRGRRSSVPRNWIKIWTDAGGKLYGTSRMIAKTTDKIWSAISDFGTDYPPFKWGSGMTLEHVDRDEAVKLGIIKPDELMDKDAEVERNNAVIESINNGIEANFAACGKSGVGLSDEEKSFVSTIMAKRGTWVGDKFVCADINGTKPYYPEDLAVILALDKSKNSQYSAAIMWFTKEGNNGYKYILNNPTKPEAIHFGNLVRRTIPMKSGNIVYRGLYFDSKADYDAFRAGLKSGAYIPMHDFESFTKSRKFAKEISNNHKYRALISVKKHSQFADISKVAEYYNPETAGELEVIPQVRRNLKFVRTINDGGNYFEAEVEQ